MSSQSGIGVGPELAKEFPNFVASKDLAYVLAIDLNKEHVLPDFRISGSVADLQSKLKGTNDARYIVLRLPHTMAFVQYMPENTPLSTKMKYASSYSTVHRQLGGSSVFGTDIRWSSLEEVSEKGLSAHFDHENAPAPLSEKEEGLAAAAELEIHGTQGRSVANQASLAINAKLSSSAKEKLDELTDGGAVVLKVGDDETIEFMETRRVDGLNKKADEPQFVVFKLDGKSVCAFVCPRSSSMKQRMLFASTRIAFYDLLRKSYNVTESIETSEPESDLLVSAIKEPEVESAPVKKFQRPKPRRR